MRFYKRFICFILAIATLFSLPVYAATPKGTVITYDFVAAGRADALDYANNLSGTATADFALRVSLASIGVKGAFSEQIAPALEKIRADYLSGEISSLSQALTPAAYDAIVAVKNTNYKLPQAMVSLGYDLYGKAERANALFFFDAVQGLPDTPEVYRQYKSNACLGLGYIYSSLDYMMYEKAKEYFDLTIAFDKGGMSGEFGSKAQSAIDGLPNFIFSSTYKADEYVTYQDFVAMMNFTLFHLYSSGDKLASDVADQKGASPADYALDHIKLARGREYYVDRPSSWTDPVPRWWAAEYLCRMRGNYTYSLVNINPFEDTFDLSGDKRMYLTRAVETGALTPLSSSSVGANQLIKRGEVAQIAARMKSPAEPDFQPRPNSAKPVVHSYFTATLGSDTDLSVFDRAKGKVDIITFFTWFLEIPTADRLAKEGTKVMATNFVEDTEYTKYRIDAVKKCNEVGIEAYFGFSILNSMANVNDITAYYVSLIEDDAKLNDLCADTVAICKKYGYSGVNLGFEFVPITSAQHTKLAAALSKALHKENMKLIVTVGAVPRDSEMNAPDAFYDYPALSKYADYIHLLTYDSTSVTDYANFGVPGVVSSLERIERCLKYAMYSFPAEKILMGFGSFAIDYTLDTSNAQNVTRTEAQNIVNSTGATAFVDAAEDGPYYEYTSAGVKHRLAFDTRQSFANRMQLVYDYGLGGVSYYWLGSENYDFHAALDDVFSRSYSAPSTEASDWAVSEINFAIGAGIVPQYLQNHYTQNITRVEFFDLLYAVAKKLGYDVSYSDKETFPDCASPAVLWAARTGITNISLDKPFSPYRTLTREEAAATLARVAANLAGKDTENAAQTTYSDQQHISVWANAAVNYVTAAGHMRGVGEGAFEPQGVLPREQAFLMIYRFYESIQQ